MAVDLSDLIPVLEREVQPPGTALFSTAVDDDWLGQLEDSFWEAKLWGFFANYTEADGLVQPITGTVELPREQQQLVVLMAGLRMIRMRLINQPTSFKAKAGPVEFDTASSANLMTTVVKQITDKLTLLLETLQGSITATQTYYISGLFERLAPFEQFYPYGYGYDTFTG